MSIAVRRSTWDPFTALVRQFDRDATDFDALVRRTFGAGGSAPSFVPAADVVRDGHDVLVTLELPGVDPGEVEVEVSQRRLVISGARTTAPRAEENTGTAPDTEGASPGQADTTDRRALVREIRSGSFRREFALPEHVTGEHVSADYDRGLLTVRVREVRRPAPEPTRVAVTTR